MRKHLQIILMASCVTATSVFFSMPWAQAQVSGGIVATTDDNGHMVYENDPTPIANRRSGPMEATPIRHNRLVFWSMTEHRWKPVPTANVRAARSAMAEVNEYLQKKSSSMAAPSFLTNSASRRFTQSAIDEVVKRAAERHNVDPNLVRALIKVESNFNPNAVSRKGAMGLMQLMPATARELNLTNPFDPEQNVDAGVRHLKKLMESFGGDVRLSLAAYNAGAGAVQRSAGIPHIAETRNYVRRITQLYNGESIAGLSLHAPVREPIAVQRDSQGALYFSNTE